MGGVGPIRFFGWGAGWAGQKRHVGRGVPLGHKYVKLIAESDTYGRVELASATDPHRLEGRRGKGSAQ